MLTRTMTLALGLCGLAVAASAQQTARSASDQSAKSSDLQAVIATDKGTIRLELYPEEAPVTVANFVNLALRGYYDGLVFHRVIPNFMIQGGDPTGTGRGGPGYRFEDETTPKRKHDKPGALSMANAGPNTNGSQFFITHVPTPHLDGKHTVFGQVVEGQDVVNAIKRGDEMKTVRIEGAPETLLAAQASRIAEWNEKLDAQVEEQRKREADFAQQDAREREQALAVLQGKGIDTSKGTTSESGVWSFTVKEGTGASPGATDLITAHCTGWLADGTKFWSSHDRGEPMTDMRANGFVPGFSEGIQTMKAGGTSVFVFPGRLGYGPGGNPRANIPPNATLIFEVELLDVGG